MGDKIRRIRCGTPRCSGYTDMNVSTTPKSRDGNRRFHCTACAFWSLMSETGTMRATSRVELDLESLPYHLRHRGIEYSPGGGV